MLDYKNKFLLDGKTTLINGGFGLLGSEITRAHLSMGSKVILLDKNKTNKQKFIKTINNYYKDKIQIKIMDTSSKRNIFSFINELKKSNIIIDSFINCSYPRDKYWSENNFKKIKYESLINNVTSNTTAYIWFSKLIADYMYSNGTNGSVTLLGSIYGINAQNSYIYEGTNMTENLTYNFLKGGIINYCKSMAAYYGKYNIRVNCISPGAISGHIAGKNEKQSKAFIKNFINLNPSKRLGVPADVASASTFLSSQASSYINGTNIVIDGGWTII